jgi:hypothetical protein
MWFSLARLGRQPRQAAVHGAAALSRLSPPLALSPNCRPCSPAWLLRRLKPVAGDPMLHLVLSSGDAMPMVGFGLWKVDKARCADCVYAAIKAGYRALDSACDYANEAQTGIPFRPRAEPTTPNHQPRTPNARRLHAVR